MYAFVVPAFGIDAIRAEHLDFTALDFRCDCADHAAVLILKELPHRRREDKDRSSGVSKDQSFHVTVQFLAVAFVIFAIHEWTETSAPQGARKQPKYLTR